PGTSLIFFFQAEDGIRDFHVTGVQTCALPISAQTEGGRPAGVPFSITLQRGEVYQVRSPGDLTGSRITTKIPENSTCKKIAVYRSEERRVGKESRSRWAAAQSGKIQMRAAETC